MSSLNYVRWRSLQNRLQAGQAGNVSIEHFSIGESESRWSYVRPGEGVDPGSYVRLRINGGVMMSNTHDEYRSNVDVLYRAHGHVLIGGLGLGCVLDCILDKPEVFSVTVIEQSKDVIDLVGSQFTSAKLTVIHGDVLKWKPRRGSKWDVIYFDIWQDICVDNLKEIAVLHQKYKHYLNRKNERSWMNSWHADHLRYLRRAGRWR